MIVLVSLAAHSLEYGTLTSILSLGEGEEELLKGLRFIPPICGWIFTSMIILVSSPALLLENVTLTSILSLGEGEEEWQGMCSYNNFWSTLVP